MSADTAVAPGFGGRVYYPIGNGFIVLELTGKR